VVEIIPQNGEVPFPDNSASRAGFMTPKAPKPGQHVKVTGPYVVDTNALHDLIYPGRQVANWAEVHRAWNVTAIRRRTGSPRSWAEFRQRQVGGGVERDAVRRVRIPAHAASLSRRRDGATTVSMRPVRTS